MTTFPITQEILPRVRGNGKDVPLRPLAGQSTRTWHTADPAELLTATDDAAEAFTRWMRSTRPDWMSSAACRGHVVATFYPARGESTEQARAICSTCPVIDDCLTWSLDQPDDIGVAAGMSGRQRRQLRAARKRGAA